MTLIIGMLHWVLECYQVCSNDDPGMTLTYFSARSNLGHAFCMEKEVKQWIFFSETIAVYVINVGRCSQLNEYMNRSTKGRHSLTLVQTTQIQYF